MRSQYCAFELQSELEVFAITKQEILLSYLCSFTLIKLSVASDAARTNECGSIITATEVPNSAVIQLYLLVFCFPLFSLLSASAHNYTGLSSVLKNSLICLLRAH